MSQLSNFLDDNNRVKAWPKKHALKREVLLYLASKFEMDRDYSEKEVNQILSEWHTFEDYFLLRRDLIEHNLLSRTRDGARYWKNSSEQMGQPARR